MACVAVLGGGISGLSCAYYLKTLGQSKIKYLFLVEKHPKFGGWIKTSRFPDGAIFEHGPRTVRVGSKAGYNALVLAEELALSSRILPVTKNHPTARTNLILMENRLVPIPKPVSTLMKTTPPFTKPLVAYIFKELLTKKAELQDESVYSFCERRIGKDVADYIIDPLCRGITAGDAKELSVRSMFSFLYESEQQYGSVLKGLLKTSSPPSAEFMFSDLVKKAYNEIWRMWTLKTGLTELIDALACAVEESGFSELLFDAECSKITFKENSVELMIEDEKILADHVFSCIPSHHLSKLVPQYADFANVLNSILSVDVAVVYLEYENDVLKEKGFGFLAPSCIDAKVLGIVFDSCSFPQLNGHSKTRLTCMIGGRWFGSIVGNPDSVSDDYIINIAIEEAKKHLHIEDSPVRTKVVLQKNCIPQYVVGHYKKLERLSDEIKKNKMCLSLLGASYKGAGVPDCIYNSKVAVEEYLKSL